MKIPTKKLKNGFELPVLGFGTWLMGGEREPDYSNDEKDINSIKNALDIGLMHIDTAELYGGGHAEELIAEAIKDFKRENIFITSKVHPKNFRYNDLINSAKNSLKRIKTDYIDLYLLHSTNPDVPIKETMDAMNFLVEKGVVKNIGVSNFSVKQLKEAQKYSKNKIVVNQIEYSLIVRNTGKITENMESEIIPYCQKNDIFVIAWRPLVKGLITKGNYSILDEISKKYKKTRAQIALNWVISKEDVVTIVKASNIEH
jgi:diketogulonate reductase-like aldo/keto reductase